MSVVSAPRFRKDRPSAVGEIRVHACRRTSDRGQSLSIRGGGETSLYDVRSRYVSQFFCTSVLLTVSVACFVAEATLQSECKQKENKKMIDKGKEIPLPQSSNRCLAILATPILQILLTLHEKNNSFKILMVSSGDVTECPVTLLSV